MAGGKWTMVDTIDPSQRSGFYLNFIADAVAGVQAGANGVVAIPVTAAWGPEATIVSITNSNELKATFSNKADGNAVKQITDALKNARVVMAYRMAVSALKAKVTLTDGVSTALLDVTAKYTGTFGNDLSITVATSLADQTKKEFKVNTGSELLEKFTFDGTVGNLLTVVGTKSLYVDLTQKATGTLGNVSGSALTGGDSGTAVTTTQYANALNAFEGKGYEWNVLAFPVSDNTFALQTTAADFIKRLRDEGFQVTAVMGHYLNADFAPAKTKALGLNHEGLVYHYIGAIEKDANGVVLNTFTPAEMTGLIAGLVAGAGAQSSVTYATIPNVDMANTLTNTQVREANAAGLMVAFYDGEVNRIEKGINTLTSFTETKHEGYGKIKVIATMDAIGNALTKSANRNYIGKVLNDGAGQDALIGATKDALDIFVQGRMVKPGYVVDRSTVKPSVGDQFFLDLKATPIDSMDEIYGTVRVGR